MEKRVTEAARNGDVEKLHNLMRDDPLLLSTATLRDGDTPLHIACIGGHLDFVREVLILCPELSQELNQDGFSPLHIAAARDDEEMVKELLKVGTHLCLAKGKERRIPLHSAAAKGRIRVLPELLAACPDSIAQATARGQTCFHLAVKSNHYQAFKVLCEHAVSFNNEEVLNSKDDRGDTLLHLAAARKQYEVFELLMEKNSCLKHKLEAKALNKKSLTPYDVLISEGGDCDIEEILTEAGANSEMIGNQGESSNGGEQEQEGRRRGRRPKSASQELQDYFKYDRIKEAPSKARNILLVITVLIMTATYQVVLSPPGGVWQQDTWPDGDAAKNSSSAPPYKAGKSVMGSTNFASYALFLLFNSMGFFMSLQMMNFLTLGLPLQCELRVAFVALVTTYDTCMLAMAPNGILSTFFTVLSIVMPLIMYLLTKVVRNFKGRCCHSHCFTNVV